jgi:hypothetical protein
MKRELKEVYPKSLVLTKKYHKGSGFQKLRSALDSLPGIETFCSSSNAKNGINIWFNVKKSKQGLFFLTRCVDQRYWKYGHIWKVELSVGDMYKSRGQNQLPVHYCLHSGSVVGRQAYKQAESLIDNMNYHLNHENFIKGFEIDLNKFKILDIRTEKLKKIIKKTKKI